MLEKQSPKNIRYDLQGRKLPSGTIPRGIFISNGKKQLGR